MPNVDRYAYDTTKKELPVCDISLQCNQGSTHSSHAHSYSSRGLNTLYLARSRTLLVGLMDKYKKGRSWPRKKEKESKMKKIRYEEPVNKATIII
jgi:hypothetical protein